MLQQAENRRDEKVEEEGHFVSLLLTRAVSAYPTFIQVGCLSLIRIEETPPVHVFVAISAPNHGAVGFIPAARTVTNLTVFRLLSWNLLFSTPWAENEVYPRLLRTHGSLRWALCRFHDVVRPRTIVGLLGRS